MFQARKPECSPKELGFYEVLNQHRQMGGGGALCNPSAVMQAT
jgi:hypothetical protein